MWVDLVLNVGGLEFKAQAKIYDTPSKFGLNGGRISKLHIVFKGLDYYCYDRGLDLDYLTGTKSGGKVLSELIRVYN
tara:strand:- start:44 stop:274 length:231 start_codon:yes stop_codon:yes gene_type:complete